MPIRVSPTETNPTHHFSLKDRNGRTIGLSICKDNGDIRPFKDEQIFLKTPVQTTALKQTSGSSSYEDFAYPYSPIVQDDLSGGRGSLDFERDSTKFYDSFRARTGRTNKVFASGLETYVTGIHAQDQNMPTNTKWHKLIGSHKYIYRRFTASSSYTVGLAWLLVRRIGTPADLTIAIYADNAGSIDTNDLINSTTVSYADTDSELMEWVNKSLIQPLINGVDLWLVVHAADTDNEARHWKIGVKPVTLFSTETLWSETLTASAEFAPFDLYYRLTPSYGDSTCIFFKYKEQQYFVVSYPVGAPTVYMIGDRGAADANTGRLNILQDATKNWVENEHIGVPVLIIEGTGKNEQKYWRTVVSNTNNELVLDTPYTITHDTTTEYVLLGTKPINLGACGLTAPVTSVHVSTKNVIYFCMGDNVVIRAMRAFNDAGTWREINDATNCQRNETDARSKATFMVYKPLAKKLVIGNNSDSTGLVSVAVSSNVSGSDPIVPDWGTSITWATSVPVDSKYIRIKGMMIHPDTEDNEAIWVFKEDCPYVVPTNNAVYQAGVDEMKAVRSENNGVNPIKQGIYLYTPLLQGLEQFYGGQFTSVGPNLGEGLPANRRGSIISMQPYPAHIIAAIDAGASGYSTVSDSGGWHERYRAPKGQRIKAIEFQPTPSTTLDRLWMWQGNDLVWLPFPSTSTNELEDPNYRYAPEFSVTFSRMHAGLYSVQKLVKSIKIQCDNLQKNPLNGEPVCYFELDYKVDDDTEFTTIEFPLTTSPIDVVDFTRNYGLAGKRLQFRLRGYTTDCTKTPVFNAIIINAVIRSDIKYFYGPHIVLLQDNKQVGLRELDDEYSADEQKTILENWADASNDSMLLLSSVANLCHNQMIFMDVGWIRQIGFAGAENNPFKGNAYLASVTFQEA